MAISGIYNPFSVLQVYNDDSDDDIPFDKISDTDRKVLDVKQAHFKTIAATQEELPLHLTVSGQLRSFTFTEKAFNSSVLLKKNIVLAQDYIKSRELFSESFEKVFLVKSSKGMMNTNYFLLKELMKDSQMATLPYSFYREAYFLMHGWVERFLKIKNPDSIHHDPIILLNEAYEENRLNFDQYTTLKMLFQVYRYFLRLEEKGNELIPSALVKDGNISQDTFFKQFIIDFELSSQALASLYGDFKLVQNKNYDVVVPSMGYNSKKHEASKLIITMVAELEKNYSDIYKSLPIKLNELKNEDLSDLADREMKCSMYLKKIDYQLTDLLQLWGYVDVMDFNNPDTVSLPLLHHLMYKMAILLESSLLFYITFNPISSLKSPSKHIIYSISGNANLNKERLLGHEHNIVKLLDVIKNPPYRLFIPKDQLCKVAHFNNFSNSVSRYPDRANGLFANVWQDFIASCMNKSTNDHSHRNNGHLKVIKESLVASLELVNKVLRQQISLQS